jgi:hypothetical protein
MGRGHVTRQVSRLQKPVLTALASQQSDAMLMSKMKVEIGAAKEFVIAHCAQ